MTNSTIKGEFVVLDKSVQEAEWLRQFFRKFSKMRDVPLLCIHFDIIAAIDTLERVLYYSITQLLSAGVISIDFIRSKMTLQIR